jgi:hypothetical protein
MSGCDRGANQMQKRKPGFSGSFHPDDPGRYFLGIECDGPTYGNAATARDRDKLRQGILEGLGWNIQHIWSTSPLTVRRGPRGKRLPGFHDNFTFSMLFTGGHQPCHHKTPFRESSRGFTRCFHDMS